MVPFHSVSSVYLGRTLMRHYQHSQQEKAFRTRDQADFEAAKQTRQTMNLLDVLMGLLRMGR